MKLDISELRIVSEVRVGPGRYEMIELSEDTLAKLAEQLAEEKFSCMSKPIVHSINVTTIEVI